MALTEVEQLQKLIEQSKHLLVLFHAKENGDAAAAAVALKQFVEKQGKHVDIACTDFAAPKKLRFLPHVDTIKPELAHLQKFIIKVDVSKTPIESLSYDVEGNTLSIILTPKHGTLSKNELRTAQTAYKHDLIITLGTPDLESLGHIFHNNTDLFYRTGIIAIDHAPTNERYGHVNIVDLAATSVSEVVYKIIKQIGEEHLTAPLATSILTGMTIATNSFKNPNITPATLQIASALVGHGAEREKIIEHLYRTRSVAALKLWGEALTHLQNDPTIGLMWTTIARESFTRSGGSAEDVEGIIEELIGNSPDAKVIVVLLESETDKKIEGLIAADKNSNAFELVLPFTPHGHKRLAQYSLQAGSLAEAEAKVLSHIRSKLTETAN